MSTLLGLPEETVLHILTLLSPPDLRSCRQTCCAINTLVATSPRLLFFLALDSLGYTLPLVPRSNLAPSEGLKLLQEHYSNWLRPNNIQPTRHSLRPHSVLSKCVGGVYAQGFGISGFLGTSATIRDLEFYQTPSKNLGVEFKRWRLENLGPGVQDFIFDPDQDLLVLLELPNAVSPYSPTCTVHLKTMGGGEAHPRALAPTMAINFADDAGSEGIVPNWSYHFEVMGDLVGILFRSRSQKLPSWVIVWDWVRGVEVTRVPTTGGWNSSFVLLDQQTLLLPRSDNPHYARPFCKRNEFGSIGVYIFDPKATATNPPLIKASFSLPSFDQRYFLSSIKLRCTSNVRSTNRSHGRPRVYEPCSEHPLVAIDVHLSQLRASGQITDSAGTLYVPGNVFLDSDPYSQETSVLHTLLNMICTRSAPEVPWHKWVSHASWVEMGDSQAKGDCLMYGYRMGTLSNRIGITDPASGIHLLDFNQRRFKTQKAKVSRTGNSLAEKHGLRSVFSDVETPSKTKYTETVLGVEGGVGMFDEVILDDEHVIICKGGRGAEPSLLVYTL
ncbi:unnamed protein product [Rhizoctonia solani]|uniref:F-box domain-containing protein n=1 Tax=Rhizoctonia solani TaxID=456999 RepID=A0A8H3H389_9AGAM|nr:unnamed protein product [Rhizoctonia solani]